MDTPEILSGGGRKFAFKLTFKWFKNSFTERPQVNTNEPCLEIALTFGIFPIFS
jgi:hypothetical protein